jgi:hypothetical protein
MKPSLILCVLLCLRLVAAPADEMAAAAKNFLAALTEEQRGKAAFAFESDERENWHFIPKERKGLVLKELTPAQRHLANGLFASGLSQRGYLKATTIMSLEQILQDIEGAGRRFPRDPELYHVSIFGTPDEKGAWGWRVEGHHLSVNFTLVKGTLITGAPTFFGSNPAEVRTGPRAGLRALGSEEDFGRELLKSLTPDQLKAALIDTKAPDDILTAANRKADLGEPKGLALAELTLPQQGLARRLLQEYVGRTRTEVSQTAISEITRNDWKKIHFAWAGGTEKGERHYYRLHGPTFLIEYDNTQNDANHVHAVYRDLKNDFGRDFLAEHLKEAHAK